jgi:hypothetical protein
MGERTEKIMGEDVRQPGGRTQTGHASVSGVDRSALDQDGHTPHWWQTSTMGAWGTGPFDNDDAADFSAELRDVADADEANEVCSRAFQRVSTASYPEISEVSEAIAAAVVVAVAAGGDADLLATPYGPGTRASGLLAQWPAEQFGLLKALASAALDRILDPGGENEWVELWQESGNLDEAQTALEPLRAALR